MLVFQEKKRKHNQEQPDDGPDLIGQESADITANNVDHVETPAARSNNEPAPQQTEEQVGRYSVSAFAKSPSGRL